MRTIDLELDLRSDAVTTPTEAMWDAMRSATLGWALVAEDESVLRLEALAAELCGKEAAIFVPTGGLANLIALLCHAKRGEQAIVEASSHILWSEELGLSYVAGLAPRILTGRGGRMDAADIEAAILETRAGHRPRTAVVCLENTHSFAGGTVLTADDIGAVCTVARRHDVAVHLDGVRVTNACVALGTTLHELVAEVDSVAVGLNKGLSAPGGAHLCGRRDFIEEARVHCRRLGGASIHQAGILAAAGLVALETMIPRLVHDHERAHTLARSLALLDGIDISLEAVQTNIVIARLDGTAHELCAYLRKRRIGALPYTADLVRLVTHRHVTDASIERVVAEVASLSASGAAPPESGRRSAR